MEKIRNLIEHHSPKDTIIFSGIALIAYGAIGRADIRLSLLLRDRTTYEPSLSDFLIQRYDDGLDETIRKTLIAIDRFGEPGGRGYFYCKEGDKRIKSTEYSRNLFDDLDEIYEKLGDEV